MDGFIWGDTFDYSFPIIFYILFFIVIVFFLFVIIKSIVQWRKNENSPRLMVPATITSKRTDVHRSTHGPDQMPSTHTSYFATFEFESHDRLEFKLSGKEYGQLAEGDFGILTFQGTRYISFIRRHQNITDHS